ncbi:hypothetical protein BH23ACT9_BH23ACT9_05330 [soil metagenome]
MDSLTGAWDHSTLPGNVHLGTGVWLEDRQAFGRFRSTRDPGLVIGDRTRAYTWTRFSIEPPGSVRIGADCVLVGALFMSAGCITIGDRVLISYGVVIADADFHPHDPDLRRLDAIAHAPSGDYDDRQPFTPADVVIDDDVQIGVGAIVLKGVHIGAGARIGAGSVVTRDVAPSATVAGNPARMVEGEG